MKIIKENLRVILCLIGIGLIAYFMLYSEFLTNPDSMLGGGGLDLRFSSDWERSLGRWLLPILDHLRGGVTTPLFTTTLSLFFLAAGILLIFSLFDFEESHFIKILIASLTICNPAILMLLTYFFCSAEYSLAFFLSVFAIWIITKLNNIYGVILSSISIVCSLGIYQSYIGVSMALALEYILVQTVVLNTNLFSQSLLQKILKMFISGIIGVISYYYIILPLILSQYNVQLSNYKGTNSLNIRLLILSLPQTIINAYKNFFEFFFSETIARNPFLIILLNYIAIIIGLFLILFAIIKQKKHLHEKFILILLIMLLPICCNVIDLLNPSTEIENMLTAGGMLTIIPSFLICSIGIVKAQKQTIFKDIFRTLLLSVTLLLLWNYLLSINTDMTYMKRSKDQRIALANRIVLLLEQNYEYHSSDQQKVYISGIPEDGNFSLKSLELLSNNTNEYATWGDIWPTHGNSIWGWNQLIMQYTGVNITVCTIDEVKEIVQTTTYKQMPNYPSKGSVNLINNIIVIKISDVSNWIG